MKFVRLFIVLIAVQFGVTNLNSQDIIDIYNISHPNQKVINLGPCYVQDSILTRFQIGNKSGEPKIFNNLAPSYENTKSPTSLPDDPLDFRLFDLMPRAYPILFDEDKQYDTLVIRFKPIEGTSPRLGWKESQQKFGLAYTDNPGLLADSSIFILRAKKTEDYLSGFEDALHFDSVYVNPSNPKAFDWVVKSTWVDSLTVHNQSIEVLSPVVSEDEFTFEKFVVSPFFRNKYQTITWQIQYSPHNMGTDSALILLDYTPKPTERPDSIATLPAKLIGTGVKQDLRIISANSDFTGDTLNIGNIRIGDTYQLELDIKNFGNIPFNSLSEVFFNQQNLEIANDIELASGLTARINDFLPNEETQINILITPTERGSFLYRYEIESDIFTRKIHSPPFSAGKVVFYIKGRAVAPLLAKTQDTIDLGNFYLNMPDCPTNKDTTITLSNLGNSTLFINNIIVSQDVPVIIPLDSDLEIDAFSTGSLRLRISPQGFAPGNYIAELRLISNQPKPNDTTIIYLSLVILPSLQGNLFIEDFYAKPGRLLSVPLKLTNSHTPISVFANKFGATVSFDSTLLRYENFSSFRTASEGASVFISRLSSASFRIEMASPKFFSSSDTLINFEFSTYLGSSSRTAISIFPDYMGDNNCDNIMNLRVTHGSFTIDSVCGLEFKTLPRSSRKFDINIISANPVEQSLSLGINIPFEVYTVINIYDIYGNIVQKLVNDVISEGIHEYYTNLNLIPGTYYIRMQADIFTKTVMIVVNK